MAKGYNWAQIETEYISTKVSMKALAEKYGIPIGTIQGFARKNNWSDKRRSFNEKVVKKAIEKAEKTQVDRVSTILRANDKLLEVVEKAIEDPDMLYRILVADKKTGKVTTRKTKAFNMKGLKQLSSALKDMLDISTVDDDGGDTVVEFADPEMVKDFE